MTHESVPVTHHGCVYTGDFFPSHLSKADACCRTNRNALKTIIHADKGHPMTVNHNHSVSYLHIA